MRSRLHSFAYVTLGFTLLVIVWGAFVRLSGSGDGCGQNWPFCAGVLLPANPTVETLIEFAHRLTSGLSFLLVLALWVLVRREAGRNAEASTFAAFAFLFMVIESLIGAALVLFGWVDESRAAGRTVALSLHLVNTFVLVSFLALTAAALGPRHEPPAAGRSPMVPLAGFVLLCVTGVTGVIAALGSAQLGPMPLDAGIRADFSADSPLLVRIRAFHPILSVATAWVLWKVADRFSSEDPEGARWVVRLVAVQIGWGLFTLLAQGPLVAKLVHLLLAQLIVVAYVTLCFRAGVRFSVARHTLFGSPESFREPIS